MEQKCALGRQILQNVLTPPNIASDEMTYRITRDPGYVGEVIPLSQMQ